MKDKFKLGIVIFACDKVEKYREQVRTLRNTWVKKAKEFPDIKVLFFLGEETTEEFTGEDYVNLKGVGEDYFSATHKQNYGIKYFYDNYDCDFIYCCGTDTYINIPKLYKYLDNFNPEEKLFVGGNGDYRTIDGVSYYFHSGGPGLFISKVVVKEFIPLIEDNVTQKWFDKCDNQAELTYLKGGCDVLLSYYLQKFISNLNVVKAETNVFCWDRFNHEGYDLRKIIACHDMVGEYSYFYTQLLEKYNYFLDDN